jgi:hypothetical protein
MITRSKLFQCVALIALTGMMNGCGGGSSSSSSSFVQTGKLVQGPVTGATVFADNVQGGVRFVQDGTEITAVTNSSGGYTLPTLPTYSYILVSKGGTDQMTGMPAIQMLAPAGAANITPLTTLVTLDTSGLLKAKLEALLPNGAKYDTDVSENSSPAVLLLVKSIETAARSLTVAISDKSGSKISDTQNAYIQARIMQAIAQTLADTGTSAADISTPSTLTTKLTTALGVAVTYILADNSNITITNAADAVTIASTLATNSVAAAAASLNVSPSLSSPLDMASVKKEATLLNAAATFMNAVTNTVTAIIGTTITAVITPPIFNPPVIPVVTVTITAIITGATGSTGSSGGTGQQF